MPPPAELELAPDQVAALEALRDALREVHAAMQGCELVGIDPVAALGASLRESLSEDQLAEIPLPLRMMLG